MSVLFGCVDASGRPLDRGIATVLDRSVAGIAADAVVRFERPWLHLGVARQAIRHSTSDRYPGDGDLLVAADARLDNRDELGRLLEIPPALLRITPDDTLIALGYRRWGEQLPGKLLGDFAFIVVDTRSRTLFAARDPIGIRPLYYAFLDGRLYLHTLINRLARLLPGPLTADDRVVVGSFISAHWHPGRTPAREIAKLEGGHCLTLCEGKTPHVRRYHEFEIPEPLRLKSDGDYVEAVRTTLEEAVACRIDSDHPVGAELSSGLDSGCVATWAARALARRGKVLHTASWCPDLQTLPLVEQDERPDIIALAEQEGMRHRFAPDTPDGLERLMTAAPYLSGGHYLRHLPALISGFATTGVRALLTGLGGDQFISFSGKGYFTQLLTERRLGRFFTEAVRQIRGGVIGPKGILSEALALAPAPLHRRLRRTTLISDHQRRLIHPAFATLADTILAGHPPETPRDIRRWQIEQGRHYHAPRLEREVEFAALHGVRHLTPLLDLRLIELLLAIPIEQHLRDGQRRALMRRVNQGILPAAILQGSKREPALERVASLNRGRDRMFLHAHHRSIHDGGIFGRYLDPGAMAELALWLDHNLPLILYRRATLNAVGLQSLLHGEAGSAPGLDVH